MWDKTILSQAEDRDSLYHILGVSILVSFTALLATVGGVFWEHFSQKIKACPLVFVECLIKAYSVHAGF